MNLILFLLVSLSISRLIGVVEICRHGARAPTHFIPQWDNYTIWPQGPGELIPEGMRQHYLIGTELRNRYMSQASLLLPNYFQPEIYIYVDDSNRTIVSAQSQVQGLYPAGTGPSLRSQLMETVAVPPIDISDLSELNQTLGMDALPNLTQVIPIHSDSNVRQYAIDASDACPYYNQLINFKQQPSSALDQIWEEYNDVITTIMQQMNYSQSQARSQFSSITDSLTSNLFVNNPFPLGFNQSFYNRALLLKNRLKNFYNFEPDILARFSGTGLLNSVLINIQSIISGNITQKLFIYSAHDTTVMCALSFMLLNHTDNPPFASTLLFEVQQYGQSYYVNIKFNDVLQNITACGGPNCSIYDFQKFVQFRSIPNYQQACNYDFSQSPSGSLLSSKSNTFDWPGHNNSVNLHWYFWLSLIFYIILSLLLCGLIGFLSRSKKSEVRLHEESLAAFA